MPSHCMGSVADIDTEIAVMGNIEKLLTTLRGAKYRDTQLNDILCNFWNALSWMKFELLSKKYSTVTELYVYRIVPVHDNKA